MADFIISFLSKITTNGKVITFLLSMFPLIELKGAIPVGVRCGESIWTSAALGYAGSSLICIPVFFLLIPIFNLLKKLKFIKKFIEKVETVLKEKAEKLAAKSNGDTEKEKIKMLRLGLFIFVAVPFPVTGVWTGTAIAVFLALGFKNSFLPLVLGNLVAGVIITLLTFFFKDYVNIIINVLFVIAIIMLIVFITKIVLAKPEKTKDE